MEKQEMEKKFKGHSTQLLQNKFKKSTSEVEKEIIASILQKRGVMSIAEGVKGCAYDEEQEKPFEVEDKNVQEEVPVQKEPKAKKEKVQKEKVIKNGLEKYHPVYIQASKVTKLQAGDEVRFIRKKVEVKAVISQFCYKSSRGVEEIICKAGEDKIFWVRTSVVIKHMGL